MFIMPERGDFHCIKKFHFDLKLGFESLCGGGGEVKLKNVLQTPIEWYHIFKVLINRSL